ncbi:thialysine N-epsilon-acetyltransferase-like isoform X1 [Macrosteles quadrilineatus]|uniref:thialysine N-epsilon-acetyltransferase-like isoform X1 n=2 Tax=Macrosteles quadrilineatus TaxID=74068 RepID=UPI0023E1A09A|nr:thialysine N-epsilon-acetyltransferase-like isoform X1 [Macrosteles quadrilineatus]
MNFHRSMMPQNNVVIREGVKSDCKEIRRLIQELADFEEMPNGPKIGYETLEKDGFETNPPIFFCYVAEHHSEEEESKLVGYALYYYTYSTWNGRKMYLEDLYVDEKYRNQHIGSQLFKTVAKKAVQENCAYLEFSVLAWNPARKFYEAFGAANLTDAEQWNLYRLTGESLRRTAQI